MTHSNESDAPRPGTMRSSAPLASCSAEPCAADAVVEALHAPGAGAQVWVPLCEQHRQAALRGEGIEYIVEVHGFVPRVLPPGATS